MGLLDTFGLRRGPAEGLPGPPPDPERLARSDEFWRWVGRIAVGVVVGQTIFTGLVYLVARFLIDWQP